MKKMFPGFYRPKAEECAQKFKDCIFSFDTSSLLNLYRFTLESRDNLLKVLGAVKDRVWLPYQVGHEYHDNRVEVIIDQREIYEALKKGVDEALKNLNQRSRSGPFQETSLIEPIRKAYEQVKADLDKKKEDNPDLLNHDPVLDALTELFDGKVGISYEPEELKKKLAAAKQRFEVKLPPGYLDSTGRKKKEGDKKYGDVILWFQLLDFAKTNNKPLIFVTGETGEDWWQKDGRRTIGPRPELLQEMNKEANGKWFYLYSTEQFLKFSRDLLDLGVKPEVIKEAIEIKEQDEENEQMMRDLENVIAKEALGAYSASGLAEATEALTGRHSEIQRAILPLTDTMGERLRVIQSVLAPIFQKQSAMESAMSPILKQHRALQSIMSPITEVLREQMRQYNSITRPFRDLTAGLSAMGSLTESFRGLNLAGVERASHNPLTKAAGEAEPQGGENPEHQGRQAGEEEPRKDPNSDGSQDAPSPESAQK